MMNKQSVNLLNKTISLAKPQFRKILLVVVSIFAIGAGTAYAGVESCPPADTIYLDQSQPGLPKWVTTEHGWVSEDNSFPNLPSGRWTNGGASITRPLDVKPGNDQIHCSYNAPSSVNPYFVSFRLKKDATTVNAQPNTFYANPAEGIWKDYGKEKSCPFGGCTFTVEYLSANLNMTHVTKSPF